MSPNCQPITLISLWSGRAVNSWRVWLAALLASTFSPLILAAPCTVDGGGGGDHSTIQAAVDDPGCDPIDIVAGTYIENVVITRALTLSGQDADATVTVIDGGGLDSVIDVLVVGGPDVNISNLTVQNGLASNGGGIYAGTGVVLDNVIVQQNVASNTGGGIYVFDGPLTMTNTLVIDNQASSAGGGVDVRFDSSISDSQILNNQIQPGGGVTQGGAGINNRSSLSVTNTIISGNTTTISGGGIFSNAPGDTLTLIDVTIENNEVGTDAGGIYNWEGTLVVESSLIRNNGSTAWTGGGIYNDGTATISDSTISGHSVDWTGAGIQSQGDLTLIRSQVLNNASNINGGGIYHSSGTLELAESNVIGNSAIGEGGGIYLSNGGTALIVVDSEISANTAENGAGIRTGVGTVITGSTLHDNTSTDFGGGIYTTSGATLALANSTLSGNSASSGGGAYLVSSTTSSVNSSTITDNSASQELAVAGFSSLGSATVRNSIIANQALGVDCSVIGITSDGFNIESGTGCGFTNSGDMQATDPMLLPLGQNGGPTPTHALDELSPAVDMANPAGCDADIDLDGTPETELGFDQRGQPRADIPGVGNEAPDEACDVGAYEYTDSLYTIGGTVSDLAGSGLVLQNKGGDDEAIIANGEFTFDTLWPDSSSYEVTVSTQPSNPNQTCSVTNGSGFVTGDNVTGVTVNCVTTTYRVGGKVSGLTGSGLVLQNNGGDNEPIAGNGTFIFDKSVEDGSAYSVTVLSQPTGPAQICSVSNGSGNVEGGNVTNVDVSCSSVTYTVGGNVTGLSGTGLVLRINGGDNELITEDGPFTFDSPLADGTQFKVSVFRQPSDPSQTCTISNGQGKVASSNVTDVRVSCTTNQYRVGGRVRGLAAPGLELQINGGDDLPVTANGIFVFASSLPDGSDYFVTVKSQPSGPNQECSVTNGQGTISGRNVTNIRVSCTTETYMVGGRVSGLAGSGLVLQNNGTDDKPITANGVFVFDTAIEDASKYSVTVGTQPTGPAQICTVSNGSGEVSGGAVTGVDVACILASDDVFMDGFEGLE